MDGPLRTVLVVDDQPLPRRLIQQALREEPFALIQADCSGALLSLVAVHRPAIILMDVGSPGSAAIEVIERLREAGSKVPVMLLSAQCDVECRVRGFDAGADDFVMKPFDARELVARVRALLRRASPVDDATKREARKLQLGPTSIDLTIKRAEQAGAKVTLTKTEFAILECLAQARGRPVARELLLRAVWGYESEMNTRTVETHIWRLRKKVGDKGELPGSLETCAGIGYALSPGAWQAPAEAN